MGTESVRSLLRVRREEANWYAHTHRDEQCRCIDERSLAVDDVDKRITEFSVVVPSHDMHKKKATRVCFVWMTAS